MLNAAWNLVPFALKNNSQMLMLMTVKDLQQNLFRRILILFYCCFFHPWLEIWFEQRDPWTSTKRQNFNKHGCKIYTATRTKTTGSAVSFKLSKSGTTTENPQVKLCPKLQLFAGFFRVESNLGTTGNLVHVNWRQNQELCRSHDTLQRNLKGNEEEPALRTAVKRFSQRPGSRFPDFLEVIKVSFTRSVHQTSMRRPVGWREGGGWHEMRWVLMVNISGVRNEIPPPIVTWTITHG